SHHTRLAASVSSWWSTRLPLGNNSAARPVASRQGGIPMQIRGLKLLAGSEVLLFVAGGVARAGKKHFKGSDSGTVIAVPGDFDADSCFPNPVDPTKTVCTDTAAYTNLAGMKSPGG